MKIHRKSMHGECECVGSERMSECECVVKAREEGGGRGGGDGAAWCLLKREPNLREGWE